MLSKKKKIIILCVMAVLLVVTGYLNIALNNNAVQTSTGSVTTQSFFSSYRTDRESTRSQEMDYYKAIVASEASSEEAKKNAEASMQTLIERMETEQAVEGLIKAKGFEDIIVTSTATNVNVIVNTATNLESSQVAQIVSIVQEQMGTSLDNICIIPVE